VGKRPSGADICCRDLNRIVQIQREHYGRGPMKAKTYALDDLIVVVMRHDFQHT
jgi:uncharacterized protein YbcI